jgi:hypothetical protein
MRTRTLKRTVALYLSIDLMTKIEELADATTVSVSAYVENAMAEVVNLKAENPEDDVPKEKVFEPIDRYSSIPNEKDLP